MSRGHNPLLWMMACTLPSAGHALGLGDIHVDSALNEPLAAEIDIVGATPEDLIGLIATVANRETFAHFNAERPSFLNTATFKVTTDAKGKPVLAIHSTESFSEPLIDLVVDLRWRNGQLIRQYSLLLDPAGFPTAPQAATALPVPPTQAAMPAALVTAAGSSPASHSAEHFGYQAAAAAPVAVAEGAAANSRSAQRSTRTMTQIKVGAKATLRGIAWRVGARSDADLNQMMIAIFRANPNAFDGNINRMHLGAMLQIPGAEDVAAIPHAEANRETRAHMQAWRTTVKRPSSNSISVAAAAAAASPASTAPVADAVPASAAPANTAPASTAPANTASAGPAPVSAATTAAPAAATAKNSDAAGEKAVLTTQLVSLEGSLRDLQTQLEAQHNKMLTLQAQQRYAEQHPTVVAGPATVEHTGRGLLAAALAGVALLTAACVALLARLRRRAKTSALPSIEKVPVMAQLEAQPVVQPKPKVAVRAPEAPRIEVQEHHEAPSEPRIEARIGMHEMRPDTQDEPMESALELSTADTSGINAAKLREELAAAKLREEIAAAWALPAAETYKREDINHESTLAQDIAKSLEDTVKLEQAQTSVDDTIEEEAYTDTIAATDVDTIVGEAGDTHNFAAATALMPSPQAEQLKIDADHLDYNLLDLDQSDVHVKMETTKEHVIAKDRRTNLVDVLKQAIEREPQRRDLRIKLLETYYAEASNNRQSFLEAVQRLAQDRGDMEEAEWQKIEQMGRRLGADSPELSSQQDDDFADCA
jgi:FimV-like protein